MANKVVKKINKKKNKGNFKPSMQNNTKNKTIRKSKFQTGKVQDARQKIMFKKREGVKDARDILAKMARTQDARNKLDKIRENRNGGLGRNTNVKVIGSNILRKTDRNGKISLSTNRTNATSNIKMAIQRELGLVSSQRVGLRRSIPQAAKRVIPSMPQISPPPRKQLLAPYQYEAVYDDIPSQPSPYKWTNQAASQLINAVERPLRRTNMNRTFENFSVSRPLHTRAYIDLDAVEDEEMPLEVPSVRPSIHLHGTSRSSNIHSRLDSSMHPPESHGIFSATKTKVVVPAGHRIVVSNLQSTVSQEDIKIHVTTVKKILSERDDKEFPSIGAPKKTLTEDFMLKEDLQRQIWNFNLKNEHFSIDTLLTFAKEHLEYNGGRTSLFKIIKSMGYKYKRVNERKILCEQKHVVAAKITFLRKFLQYKSLDENIRFVFLDETWIYQNGSSVRRWTHESDMMSNPSKIKSEGKRFTVLHARSNFGFLEGCDFILDSKNNDRDYHKTMTSEIFQNWVINQLIPSLSKIPVKCVVVMDNAPYHSVQLDKPPTFSSKKSEMQDWLIKNKIDFNQNFTKKQLWNLILPLRTDRQRRYVVDDLLKEHGHEVLRLPPYHCQYNPIEMAWAFCKNFYNKNINSHSYTKDRVLNLWSLALSKCTTDMWQNFYLHCERLITEDWTKHMGNLPIADIPPFIISLEESDSDLEFSEDDSDSNDDLMDVE